MDLIFVVSFFVVLMYTAKMASVIAGNSMSLPHIRNVSISNALIAYPCWFYQIYFWAERLNIFT